MAVFRWTGQASSNFGTAADWYDVTTGAPSITSPGLKDEAITTAAGAIGGNLDVFELALTGTTFGLMLSGVVQTQLGYLDGEVTLSATAQLYATNLLDLGDGSINSSAGSGQQNFALMAGSIIDVVASAPNSGGLVVGQNGANAQLSLAENGMLGSTVLTYADGGSNALTVGNNGAVGVITVTGAGSALGAYGQTVVGANTASGSIEVAAQGRVSLGVDAAGEGLSLGINGGNGSLTLADASQGNLQGQTVVGGSGVGSVSVTGASGLLALSTTGTAVRVGSTSTGTGSVLVSDAYSFLNVSGGLVVGAGGTGALTVENNARVVSGDTMSPTSAALSIAAGGVGTVTVESQAELVALGAGIAVGAAGDGALTLSNATITVTTSPSVGVSAFDVGIAAGSAGTMAVTDGGLVLDTQAAGMIVGDAGIGTLSVGGGSGQDLIYTGDPTGPAGLAVGNTSAGNGLVSIAGTASGIGVYGAIADGVDGAGSIALTDGGHLVADFGTLTTALLLGENSDGVGAMSVNGGSQLYVVGQSVIGDAGTGVLSITGGSSFAEVSSVGTIYSSFSTPDDPLLPPAGLNAALTLGLTSTATGSALVSDPGTFAPVTGGLVVGEAGSGSLSVTNDAILTVNGNLGEGSANIILGDAVGSTGTLSISAGAKVADTGGISVGFFGQGELDVTDATLTIDQPNVGGALNFAAGPAEDGADPFGVVNVVGGVIDDVAGAGINLGVTGGSILSISQYGTIGGVVSTSTLTDGESGIGIVTVDGSASELKVGASITLNDSGLSLTNGSNLVDGNSPESDALILNGALTLMSLDGGALASVIGSTQIIGGTLSVAGGSGFNGAVDGSLNAKIATLVQGGGITVSDPGSFMNLMGLLVVGDGAGYMSSMIVENGALVTVTAADPAVPAMSIGNDSNGDMLVVDGAGSQFDVTGQFAVGAGAGTGAGEVTISGGGTMTVVEVSGQSEPAAEIGAIGGTQTAAGAGVTVTGPGSEWTVGGAIDVGVNDNATAGLSVLSGGQVNAEAVLVDDLQNGQVYVDGTGSTLNATSLTLSGGPAYDTLSVADGGVVLVSGDIGLDGTVELFGGTLISSTTVSLSAQSVMSGYGTIGANSIVDAGAIAVSDGTMTCLGAITGGGVLSVDNGVLSLGASEDASVSIEFLSAGGTLSAQSIGDVAGAITGWSAGDFIDLPNVTVQYETFSNGTLRMFNESVFTGSLSFSGALTASNFTITTLSGGGTEIGYHG